MSCELCDLYILYLLLISFVMVANLLISFLFYSLHYSIIFNFTYIYIYITESIIINHLLINLCKKLNSATKKE